MSDQDHSLSLVWPQAPEDHTYAKPSFPGGQYISTGYFPTDSLGHNGTGRSEDNLAGCTSILFDMDLIDFITAWRHAHGHDVPTKAKDRKQWMWDNIDDSILDELKVKVGNEVLDHLVQVLGFEPTLIVDSGWGMHFHYAVSKELRGSQAALKAFHQRVVAATNEKVLAATSNLIGADGAEYHGALDPSTCDVGTRVVRRPGTMNTKCPTRHKPCKVVGWNSEIITPDVVDHVNKHLPMPTTTKKKVGSNKKPASKVTSSKKEVNTDPVCLDFSALIDDGDTLLDLVQSLEPGETMDIVCPFAGTSLGSAFLKHETSGKYRLTSNALGKTFWHFPAVTEPPLPPEEDPEEEEPAESPRATLTRRVRQDGSLGAIQNSMSNLVTLFLTDGDFDLWFDEFRNRVMDGDKEVNLDRLYVRIRVHMEQVYGWMWAVQKNLVIDAVTTAARTDTRNPVKDYLLDLEWDGVSRLDQWVQQVILHPGTDAGVPALPKDLTDLYATYGRKWAISLIARAVEPGCKVDTQLILYGRQGFGKQHIWKAWCPFPDLYSDTPLVTGSKDAYLALQGCWVYEDAELASGTRAKEESKKAFLSSATDKYRPPYARDNVTVPRTCVIVGSTNEADFLKDRTGSRRYWVVECPRIEGINPFDPKQPSANYAWILQHRDQLLAEAFHLYSKGEKWWLSNEEDAQRHTVNEESHTHLNEWDMAALAVYQCNKGGLQNAISCKDFAIAVDPDLSPRDIAKIGYTLSGALTSAGFIRSKKRVHNRVAYYKPVPSGCAVMKGNGLNAVGPVPVKDGTWRSLSL